jgi:hypothetical protein
MSTPSQPHTDNKQNKPIQLEEQNALTINKRKRFVWWLFTLGMLVLSYILLDIGINLFQNYFVDNHKELTTYLEKIDLYNNDSDMMIDNIRLKLYRMDEEEYLAMIQEAKGELQQMVNQTVSLQPPLGFSQYKQSFLAVMNQRIVILSNYEETKRTYTYDVLNTSIGELDRKQGLERKELMNAFKKTGIKYRQLGDGSIRFWYKNHIGKQLTLQ